MNEQELINWWRLVSRQSWTYGDLIGQTTTLPVSLGGTGTSTVPALASTLGLSSMAYQASSNVAITGGSLSSLGYLSTTAVSTGTLRALTNVSSATVSTGNLFGTSLSTSTFALAISSVVSNLNANYLQGNISSFYLATTNHTLAVTTISVAHSPYTVSSTDRYIRCTCSSGSITVLFPLASAGVRELFVKKIDSSVSTVTISSVATDTFDGAVTTVLATQYATKGFISPVSGVWERLNVPTI